LGSSIRLLSNVQLHALQQSALHSAIPLQSLVKALPRKVFFAKTSHSPFGIFSDRLLLCNSKISNCCRLSKDFGRELVRVDPYSLKVGKSAQDINRCTQLGQGNEIQIAPQCWFLPCLMTLPNAYGTRYNNTKRRPSPTQTTIMAMFVCLFV